MYYSTNAIYKTSKLIYLKYIILGKTLNPLCSQYKIFKIKYHKKKKRIIKEAKKAKKIKHKERENDSVYNQILSSCLLGTKNIFLIYIGMSILYIKKLELIMKLQNYNVSRGGICQYLATHLLFIKFLGKESGGE